MNIKRKLTNIKDVMQHEEVINALSGTLRIACKVPLMLFRINHKENSYHLIQAI